MKLSRGVRIDLRQTSCTVRNHPVDKSKDVFLWYASHPVLRDTVQRLILATVREHHTTLFPDVCGRCGNSCRRTNIVVRQNEFLRLSSRLGITEEDFRATYLEPIPTWNGEDGKIRLQDGWCPLVIRGKEDLPTACSVHDVRPSSCRDFRSNSPICQKDPGHLIEEIELIHLSGPTIHFHLRPDTHYTLENQHDFWRQLCKALQQSEPTQAEKLSHRIRILAHSNDRIKDIKPSRADADYHQTLVEQRKQLEELKTGVAKNPVGMNDLEWLEQIDYDLRGLEDLYSVFVHRASDLGVRESRENKTITLLEDRVQVSCEHEANPSKFMLLEYPRLSALVQGVLAAVLTLDDDHLQMALTDSDPPCYRCGACCQETEYGVEIQPSDIDRLCQMLDLRPVEFVHIYTSPGIFSWNKQSRILDRKNTMEHGYEDAHRNWSNLRVIGQPDENNGCVFLKRDRLGYLICGVHSHKPLICHLYEPNRSICRKTNQIKHWGRQALNVRHVTILREEVALLPISYEVSGRPPFRLPRLKYPLVESATDQLEHEVDRLMQGLAGTDTKDAS